MTGNEDGMCDDYVKTPKILKKINKEREIRALIRYYHAGKLAQISLLSHCMCLMYVCFSTYLAG